MCDSEIRIKVDLVRPNCKTRKDFQKNRDFQISHLVVKNRTWCTCTVIYRSASEQRHSPIPIRTSFVVDVAARSNQYVKPFYWKIQVNINFTSHVWHFLKLMSPSSSCVRLSRWVNRVLQFYNDCKVVGYIPDTRLLLARRLRTKKILFIPTLSRIGFVFTLCCSGYT